MTVARFDLDERNYDMLYSSKLELLLELNRHELVTWSGPHRRRALQNTLVVPRPEQPLRIWLGTGGSPESVLRAVELGVPMFLGILGGTPEHWAQYGHAYRGAWAQASHPADDADIAVAVHGFVAEDDREAETTYLEHELRMFQTGSAEIGRPMRPPAGRVANLEAGRMVFAGGPNEVADRILRLHELLGHSRQILQMDVGACRTQPSSRASSYLAPGSSPRSPRSSNSDDAQRTRPAPRGSDVQPRWRTRALSQSTTFLPPVLPKQQSI